MLLPIRKTGTEDLETSTAGKLPVIRDRFDVLATRMNLDGLPGEAGDRKILDGLFSCFVWDGKENCRLRSALQAAIKGLGGPGERERIAALAAERARMEFLGMLSAGAKEYVGARWFRDVKPWTQLAGMLAGSDWDIRILAEKPTPYEVIGTDRGTVMALVFESGLVETTSMLRACHALNEDESLRYALERDGQIAHWTGVLDARPEWVQRLAKRLTGSGKDGLGLDPAEAQTTIATLRAARHDKPALPGFFRVLGESLRGGDEPGSGR